MPASPPFAPMEALLVEQLPTDGGWQYEPKWDGFRCIAVRDGSRVEMWSKSGKPLDRYFPEVAAMLGAMRATRFIVDGELLVEADGAMSFDALQARLHPTESRIRKLSAATPAQLILFDCLSVSGQDIAAQPLERRRAALEKLIAGEEQSMLHLSPRALAPGQAAAWFEGGGTALDGVIAKRLADSYCPGERAMLKVKARRTADCVIGGYRREKGGDGVASLLLGLFGDDGLLHHVGFTSSISAATRPAWTAELEARAAPASFTGNAPGGPSRWSSDRSADWQAVKPELVVEVLFDQVTGDRFRHGTRLVRRRPDKAPRQCTMEQMRRPLTPAEIRALIGG